MQWCRPLVKRPKSHSTCSGVALRDQRRIWQKWPNYSTATERGNLEWGTQIVGKVLYVSLAQILNLWKSFLQQRKADSWIFQRKRLKTISEPYLTINFTPTMYICHRTFTLSEVSQALQKGKIGICTRSLWCSILCLQVCSLVLKLLWRILRVVCYTQSLVKSATTKRK